MYKIKVKSNRVFELQIIEKCGRQDKANQLYRDISPPG